MIKNRLADGIDERIWKLQFGFRGKKSTAQAIHIIRRIIDQVCRAHETHAKLNMVLLDWEKAFEKVSHQGLPDALERMAVAPNIRSLIIQLYKKQNTRLR